MCQLSSSYCTFEAVVHGRAVSDLEVSGASVDGVVHNCCLRKVQWNGLVEKHPSTCFKNPFVMLPATVMSSVVFFPTALEPARCSYFTRWTELKPQIRIPSFESQWPSCHCSQAQICTHTNYSCYFR